MSSFGEPLTRCRSKVPHASPKAQGCSDSEQDAQVGARASSVYSFSSATEEHQD